jgi:DNA-directed RNA polymerase subunit H (RpoH/RPB5)
MQDDLSVLGSVHKAVNCDGRMVLRRVITTCKEMLADRGCTSICVHEDAMHTSPVVRGTGASLRIEVYLHVEDKVGVKYMRQILSDDTTVESATTSVHTKKGEQAETNEQGDDDDDRDETVEFEHVKPRGRKAIGTFEYNLEQPPSALNVARHVVVISPSGPTPFTRKEFERSNVQFFLTRDMCYNPTRHALVPRHEVVRCPPEGVSREELPRLLSSDRIVQYYNWPIGTIVHIRRVFGGHEPVSYFRIVVSPI